MTSSLPTFGPTGPPVSDYDVDAMAVVRLAVVLSRAHLRTALAASYAEMGEARSLADLDVSEIRREVEGYLGANALVELDRETGAATARALTPDRAQWLAALDEAVTRAYAVPATAAPLAQPRYGDGTVTLATEDHGDVTLPEPAWCAGHPDPHRQYRTDLTHYGPEHRLTFNGIELFRLMLSQTPYAERESREVCAYVEESGYTGSLDPAGLYDLAASLDHAADHMREFADQLAVLLDGSGQ